jgi:hypothetical protein
VRLPVVAIIAASLLSLTVPSAQAETWSAKDRRADVRATPVQLDSPRAADDCSGPRGHRQRGDKRRDVLGLAVEHTTDAVVLTISMREVARHDKSTTYELHLQTPLGGYALALSPINPEGPDSVFFSEEPDYPDPDEIEGCTFGTISAALPCDGLTGERDGTLDRIVITVPRACLKTPDWVRAAAETYGYSRTTASGRFVVFSDFWSRAGGRRQGFLPPFGPRVRSR